MARNPEHPMLAKPNRDERSRQDFIGALKRRLSRDVRPANRDFYTRDAAPAFAARRGRPPRNEHEVGEAMAQNTHWQVWSILNYAAQRQMWASVTDTLERCQEQQQATYERLVNTENRRGSLQLDADLPIPEAILRTEIHGQPGGYALQRFAGDFRAGALYEAGGMIYSRGQGVGTAQSKAEVVVRFLGDTYPDFRPASVLDMACSAGASSTPYAETFPAATIHGIDVAPGLLRYAHARAEALGHAVHFHQRDVTDSGFPDASFDLVVSHNALHEMSRDTARKMFKESFRLLKPGGICVHQDLPLRYDELDCYARFERSWDRRHNGEIFWLDYATLAIGPALEAAGFAAEDCFLGFINQADASVRWYAACARKPRRG